MSNQDDRKQEPSGETAETLEPEETGNTAAAPEPADGADAGKEAGTAESADTVESADAAEAADAEDTSGEEASEAEPEAADPALEALRSEIETVRADLGKWQDLYLRLGNEYENYRRRTAKEKESLSGSVRAETAAAFLPVYDNLERALKQETADAAYKKGVEMTMSQLREVFANLGIVEIEALGKPFDPNLHNAVMHVEDPELGENVVAEVFQSGFLCGDKVVRCAMVKVAN